MPKGLCGFQKGNKLGVVHGHNPKSGRSLTYASWAKMIGRCTSKNNDYYTKYGGAGITVCDRWLDFKHFLEDMGERKPGLSIDRIDGSKGYYKENCRWATKKEQQNNLRRNILVTFKGKTQNITLWCEELELCYTTIVGRFKAGWTPEKMFGTPIKKYRFTGRYRKIRSSEPSS